MIIRDLRDDTVTVSFDSAEAEQLARILFEASRGSCTLADGDLAETLASFFTATTMVCRVRGW